ncbi:MAG: transketolase [Nitrososphaerota archaeon]|jgi:transketolase|nr:transketolase [Nitrososphaerota archaeon]MDG7040088.1 transketolase [Nitrososphaerota archaeon]
MKKTFASELENLMQNEDTYLLTGDLGFSMFENIKERYRSRYVNMGLSEQNMIGVAAGMALAGKNVFVYSIIPFLIYRPFEHVRNDICYQNLPVKLMGAGAGFVYSDAGYTHHSIEDYGILSSLPNIVILSPSDPLEVSKIMHQINDINNPVYVRLAQNGAPNLHSEDLDFVIGKAIKLLDGDDVLIVTSGTILKTAVQAAEVFDKAGLSVTLLEYHTIKPFDEESLVKNADGKKAIITIEEHVSVNGLYSIVLQVLNKRHAGFNIIPFGINKPLDIRSGSQEFMKGIYGLESESIYRATIKKLGVL